MKLGEAEVNIKLSDVFRGRYALPIGGSLSRPLLYDTQNDKRKESERVKNLPPPQEQRLTVCLPAVLMQNVSICLLLLKQLHT